MLGAKVGQSNRDTQSQDSHTSKGILKHGGRQALECKAFGSNIRITNLQANPAKQEP